MNTINPFTGVQYGQTARPVATPQMQANATPVQTGPQETVGLSNIPRGVCFMKDGQAVYLPKAGEQLTMGRDPKSSVVFEDQEISRRHAAIAEKDGKSYLQDLGSSNGTYLNGQQLEPGKWVEFKRVATPRLL